MNIDIYNIYHNGLEKEQRATEKRREEQRKRNRGRGIERKENIFWIRQKSEKIENQKSLEKNHILKICVNLHTKENFYWFIQCCKSVFCTFIDLKHCKPSIKGVALHLQESRNSSKPSIIESYRKIIFILSNPQYFEVYTSNRNLPKIHF